MSYINWGSESPEQLAIRRQIEEQALYEQAVRSTRARNRAGNTPGAAAGGGGYTGGGDPLAGLYGVGSDGLIYSLNQAEANWPYNYEPSFPAPTSLALNTDNGFLYAILDFDGEVFFIKIDRITREFTFIENNISDFITKGSSSLYYEGNGSFIYLDNFFKSSISSIIRITLNNDPEEVVTVEEVAEVDSESTGFLLTNLFLYDGTPWATAIFGADTIVGPFNINTGEFSYYNLLLPSPNQPNIVSIVGAFDMTEHNGSVYSVLVWTDGNGDDYLGLFTMDTEYGGASAPYYVTFVKDLLIESAEDASIFSIVSF